MVPVLSILSGLGAIQSIISLNGLIYNSLGKTNIAFKVSLISNVVLIIAFTIGVNYGIIGISYSYLIASLVLFVPIYHTAIKQLNISLLEVFMVLKGVIIATLVMTVVLFLFNSYFDLSLVIGLILKIILGFVIYGTTLLFFEKPLLLNLKFKLKSLI